MDFLELLLEKRIYTSTIALAGFFLVFWNLDKIVWSKEGAEHLHETIFDADGSRKAVVSFLTTFSSLRAPAWVFVSRVLLITGVSLLAMLLIYLFKVPELALQLATDRHSVGPFMRHILLNGFVVVFVTNYVSYSLYSIVFGKMSDEIGKSFTIVFSVSDIFIRVMLYFFVSALVYSAYAYFFGAFGGNIDVAIRSVFVTLLESLALGNLAGVYFYAAMLGAFPLYIIAIADQFLSEGTTGRTLRFLSFLFPLKNKPLRASSLVVGVFVFLSVSFASTIARIAIA